MIKRFISNIKKKLNLSKKQQGGILKFQNNLELFPRIKWLIYPLPELVKEKSNSGVNI